MKRWNTILLIAFLAFAWACSPYPRESERMATALREAMALYGDEGVLPDDTVVFIPDLDRASAYYAGKKQYGTAALAALYHGYAEEDYNKSVAMEAYKEAEHYGTVAGDSLTVARAQYRMGRMLLDDGEIEDAKTVLKNAESLCEVHLHDLALIQNVLAVSYMLLGQYDSAQICLFKSLENANNSHSEEAQWKTLNNIAVLYKIQGRYEDAIQYLNLIEKNADSTRFPLLFLNLGDLYFAMGEMDSAALYYDELKLLLSKTTVKKETLASAYNSFYKYALSQGDYPTALQYQSACAQAIDEIRNIRESKSVYLIKQKYDHEVLLNTMYSELSRKRGIIVLMSLFATLLSAALALKQRQLAIRKKQEAETKARLFYFMQKGALLENTNNVISQQNSQYAHLLSESLKTKKDTMLYLEMLLNNPSKKHLLKRLEMIVFHNEDHWLAFLEIMNQLYPNLWETQKTLFPQLTNDEQKILYLSNLYLSRQEEAYLLNTSVHMVDKLRGRVRKKTKETGENPA